MNAADRDLLAHALRFAGMTSERKFAACDMQALICALVRLAQRLDGEIAHLQRQLAGMSRPAGMTGVERDHVRNLGREVERVRFRLALKLAEDTPVPYALTGKAEALLSAEEVITSA